MQGLSLLDPNGLFSPFGKMEDTGEPVVEAKRDPAPDVAGQTGFVLVGKRKTKEKWRKEIVSANLTEAKRLATTLMGGEQIDLYVHGADDTPLAMKMWGYKWRDIRVGPVRRPGAQKGEDTTRWSITMTKKYSDIASRIGNGNVSKGIRIAILAYKEQSENKEAR